MTLQELIDLKVRFEPYLNDGDYTFIGPNDLNLLSGFIANVNFLAPANFFATTFGNSLRNQDAVLMALSQLQSHTQFRIFVVLGDMEKSGVLIHSTIEEYCNRNKIEFL
ncbi:hypothetical protein [Algoriphagus yeomjeoni]|uniref:Uncharacterized protein n=1 Tax=Algoriphagus yeomjeoni TaxID=291403 RepID=A0A327P344_9BACT|nr:hypothetical protein [Algoriphagus yeomjeoni]RAI86725.1 hypothetical protein LV83_03281 [Algoriphagus yeomjeoni]